MLNLLAQTYTLTNDAVNASESTGVLAVLAGAWLFFMVLLVVSVIALWKIFQKAGIPGWKAIVPFYNQWLLFEMAGKPGWWALVGLLAFIPVLGFVVSIVSFVLYCIAALELGKAFGKSQTFSIVGLIIFSLVGLMILGFGGDKYKKPASAPASFS